MLLDENKMITTKAGFVAIVGRPNAGKSTLLNCLIKEDIALVSHKINATRKRMNVIVMHSDKSRLVSQDVKIFNTQIIFIDTPGIHYKEKVLNQFMLEESLKAIEYCDLVIFLAPITDNIDNYVTFLSLNKNKQHIILLSKIDLVSKDFLISKLSMYKKFEENYLSIIPISSIKSINLVSILDEISKHLPESPYLYDTEIITTHNLKEIYKEKIRESIFDNVNQEIPYESDVVVDSIIEGDKLDKIYARIIVEKKSQKIILIGKNARTIKNIGINARKKIESFSAKKVFLKLEVIIKKGWSKDKNMLKEIGYY